MALGVAALMVVLLVALWLARLPLATRFVDRELARAGVPARYTLAGLTPRGQRIENVVIGDPADPDLVADWIETETGVGLSGPYLDGVRAGHVRINARLVGGRVSLGSIDRLLPAPSGKPFALPRLRVASQDVRIRLATAAGVVGLKLAGEGRLDDGFRGTLAAVAPRLAVGGCAVAAVRASVRLAVSDAAPAIEGPVRATRLACAGARARALRADLDLRFSAALNAVGGGVRLATGAVEAGPVRLAALDGRVGLDAAALAAPRGDMDLTLHGVDAPGAGGARSLSVRAPWGMAGGTIGIGDREVGRVGTTRAAAIALRGGTLPRGWSAPLRAAAATPDTTPLAPIARGLAGALLSATGDFDAELRGGLVLGGAGPRLWVDAPVIRARSGAFLRAEPLIAWSRADGLRVSAGASGRTVAVGGGGLPGVRALVDDHAPGDPWRLRVTAEPYRVGDARLALAPMIVFEQDGIWQVATEATLSGPVGPARADALVVPIRARLANGVLLLNPGCNPVSATALTISGLRLDRPSLTLCATGPSLIRVAGGTVSGGARLPELRLRGRLGASPLAIDGEGARIDLAGRGFAIEGLRTRLGAPDRETRLNFASLGGRINGGAVAGSFAGGTGRIGAVPLALGEAAGAWRFAGGALDVTGTLVVSDTADAARFQPMRGEGVTLRLADNAITAAGSLVEPTTGTRVAGVTIAHALGSGVGHADLAVPGITFREGFQPELLTRVTFGVIADVKGTVAGAGRIDWSPAGVSSTGRFRTDGTDLAAAFGPVAGIAGEIAFDDLLSLRSAPNQRVAVRSINPGIEVTDGVIRFRTLSGTQVQVDNGHWPFAGGSLTLQPTLLDFGQDRARRMTFVVTGAAADKFLQQFAFDNLQATGTFDGTLPMVFDQTGGRIEGGRLTMREGGGTIAYLGDLTQKDLGFWGNLAFQSLRSLRYRNLDIVMNGPLAGEMVTEVKFAGVSQGEGAKSNFIIRRLQRLPFVFNIRIQAPFRGLLDSVQSFYDPKRLIDRNLPALLEAQRRAQGVQPPASEKVP